MNRCFLGAMSVALLGSVPVGARAQASSAAAWDSVSRILKTPTVETGGYHRYNFPRRDITLKVGDVTVATALALGAWAGFSGGPADAMTGDLVLTAAELRPVQAELANQRIDVTAVHNHLVGEAPQITYVHFHAQGAAIDLATRLERALALTATPRPVAAAVAQPVTIDTAAVFRTLGLSGRAQGNVAQVSTLLVPGTVTLDGHALTPALAYGSPINIQMAGPDRAVATGDLAVVGSRVDPVLDAFAAHRITTTAVHSHLIGESPTIYYIHFWADGPLADVLRGLRAALDAGR
ncbi:MAG TPA: DUF1259 domain-containing protein [Gemmatimonadales bacterium]